MEMISASLVFKAAKKVLTDLSLTLDGDDELRNDWKNLCSSLLKHIKDSLDSEESVWILLLSDTLEEDWQVMMVVKLLNFNFPVDLVLRTMLNCNRKVTSVVESSELT
jgi:hypothetical protein